MSAEPQTAWNQASRLRATASYHRAGGFGFTLLELMMVVALIGILTAMILPEMKSTYEAALLRSTSRDLVNVFSLAYSRAVSLNQAQFVRLDPAKGGYLIAAQVREAGDADSWVPVRDIPGGDGTLDRRISVKIRNSAGEGDREGNLLLPRPGGPPEQDGIGFYPDGTADAREILLEDREGFRLLLRINPITARVQITELPRGSPGSAWAQSETSP